MSVCVEEPKANTNILIFSILLMSTEAVFSVLNINGLGYFLVCLHKANRLKRSKQLNECDAETFPPVCSD